MKKVSNVSACSERPTFLSFRSWAGKFTKEGHDVTWKRAFCNYLKLGSVWKGTADMRMVRVHPVELSVLGWDKSSQGLRDSTYPKTIYGTMDSSCKVHMEKYNWGKPKIQFFKTKLKKNQQTGSCRRNVTERNRSSRKCLSVLVCTP